MQPLKLGTRASALALAQTDAVIAALAAQGVAAEAVTFSTRGDRDLSKPLHELGDKGLFTLELEAALRSGEIDAAVHSAKDMSALDDAELPIVGALEREAKGDVLVGASLADLPEGARVGTSSLRRAAQLKALRPDLQSVAVRGNLNTRLAKLEAGEADALILAEAGLRRLGLLDGLKTESLPFRPAPAQGIIAIQAATASELWSSISHGPTLRALHIERALVRGLGANCRLPVALDLGHEAVLEAWHENGTVMDAKQEVRTVAEAEALGAALLARLPEGYFSK